MFVNDAPIEDKDDDLLDRARFAELVADAISRTGGEEPFVVGLYGEWGSGKTSIVNLALRHIRKKELAASDESKLVVLKYNPWACSTDDELQYQFFVQLAGALSKGGRVRKAGKGLAKLIVNYGGLISVAGAQAAAVDAAAKPVLSRLAADADIADLRRKIEKKLSKAAKHIVIAIDDLDRLSDTQIAAVFQLVSAVANFKNTVFILSFDYKVVASALDGVQGGKGAEYLAKVVQIPLIMPYAKPVQLRAVVERLISANLGIMTEAESRLLDDVISNVVVRYVHTIRDAKRLANAFSFSCLASSEELNKIDLLGLSAVQAFDPGLYLFIANHKKLLCELEYRFSGLTESFQVELDDALREWFDDGGRNEQRKAVLKVLFSKVANSGRMYSMEMCQRTRRLSSADYFDAYFSFSLGDIAVSGAELAHFMESPSKSAEVVDDAIERGGYIALLEEASLRIEDMKPEAREELVLLLFSRFGKVSESISSGFISRQADYVTEDVIRQALQTLDSERANRVIKQAFERADLDNLTGASVFLNSQELAHGRLAATEAGLDRQFMSEECLDDVEEIYMNRLREFARDSGSLLLQGTDAHMLMYLWSQFDYEHYKSFWDGVLASGPANYACVPICFAQPWSSSDDSFGWTFDRQGIQRIVDEEDLREAIVKALREGLLNERFSELDRCKVVMYLEKPDASIAGGNRMSYEEALRLLERWE